ncbi:hypothetical protein ABZX63_33445 [Streptomyces tendae]|uniref:hypothetical protein n=1 Tax=Streptomyces tendae TaxID=1932 RepID=UPI0033B370E9
MTAHPIPENHDHWWLATGEWRRLHAVPGEAITRQQMRDAIDDARPVPARAVCGLHARWDMPGFGSRFALARCAHCCHALGIPAGTGTPANKQTPKEA